MPGRSFVLLVTLLLVWSAVLLTAQSARFTTVPDTGGRTVRTLPPHVRAPLLNFPRSVPPSDFRLPLLTRAAGMIFSGTVTAISRKHAASSQALDTVAITFHVENAIRGAIPGQTLTITQWTGALD